MTLKILVVYQDASVAALMVESLEEMGMEAVSVSSRSDAAALAAQQRFDGIFLDPGMPAAGACELAARVRQTSANRSTPVFVLSVRPEGYAVAQALESAGTYFLKEPVERQSLTRLLTERRGDSLEHRRKPREPLNTEVVRRAMSIEFTGMSRDISEDGIVFRDDGSLELGQKVELSFSLPGQQQPIEIEGVVARVDSDHRVVVCFTVIADDDRERIKDFLAVRTR
jgi:CheY-like chemotaxis protein